LPRQSVPFLSFNRGLLSPKALARVDIDRTRLSAEVFTNFIPATQGSLSLRPGTKYFGSSLRDSGAEYLEFVASTDDVALVELTDETMRIWLGDDAHELALLSRPAVNTTVTLSDTGWSNASTGGAVGSASAGSTDLIPTMTSATVNGVTISADAADGTHPAYHGADDSNATFWQKSGGVPAWLNINFGSGNTKAVGSYSLRARNTSGGLNNQPKDWRLIGANFDTGTFATDTGKWILEDERTNETGWAVSEKRTYTITDTGTPGPWRNWRLYVTALNGDVQVSLAEFELFQAASAGVAQAQFSSGVLTLNATSVGALAKATKRVILSDTGTEHSLAINVERGPVTLRVGSTSGDDDLISETAIGTGHHNLAFTPETDFHITLQSDALVDRIVSSLEIGDSGTVEVPTQWGAEDVSNIRYDQSADVMYANCDGVQQQKIERRGTGRSWSAVDYAPDNGPFLTGRSANAKLSVSHFYGNTTMDANIPFFSPLHVGALFRLTHSGQSGEWALGALNAVTDAVKVTGINDTGNYTADNERRVVFTVSGSWAGRITIERSFDGPDFGFKKASVQRVAVVAGAGLLADTGTFTTTIDDLEDNLQVWYRAKVTTYTSGVPIVHITYRGGQTTGIARVTAYNDNQTVDIEVLRRFSDTGLTDQWQEGYWSDLRGYPTAVALNGGRLGHASGANLFLSVSDDFENFDQDTEGDAGPIIRTLGSGPVDSIHWMLSLLRLIVGTAGAELAVRSSSLDEPLTPDNSSAVAFSTQGSANMRAVKMDTRGIMVQRSTKRVFMIGPAQNTLADYEAFDLTLLVPDLLAAGAVSIAIQRQPDTRIHVVRADGLVSILTYEPQEEVICWTMWETDGAVEKAMCLPGIGEDAVYYHIRRTIGNTTRRFLEKWALESECQGDTGLNWLMDCAVSFSDTGRATFFNAAATHLAGESVIVWGDLDTGSTPYVDLSPDVNGVQTTWALDTGGDLTLTGLTNGVHRGTLGLPYQGTWLSTKLAYAAQFGTALANYKRVDKIGLILYNAHNNGLFLGSDSGHLDPLPRMVKGAVVDPDHIFPTLDAFPTPFNGVWDEDSRFMLVGKAPRPVTILACVPTVDTEEKN
jgi:hypothetical protein